MVVLVLVVGCAKDIGGDLQVIDPAEIENGGATRPADGGPRQDARHGGDAGCPDYPDSGTVQLVRGCPLTIEYSIN